ASYASAAMRDRNPDDAEEERLQIIEEVDAEEEKDEVEAAAEDDVTNLEGTGGNPGVNPGVDKTAEALGSAQDGTLAECDVPGSGATRRGGGGVASYASAAMRDRNPDDAEEERLQIIEEVDAEEEKDEVEAAAAAEDDVTNLEGTGGNPGVNPGVDKTAEALGSAQDGTLAECDVPGSPRTHGSFAAPLPPPPPPPLPLACPHCGRGYKRRGSLWKHVRRRHEGALADLHKSPRPPRAGQKGQPPAAASHKCAVCGRDFKSKHHLKEHFRIHSGEKPYGCPICKKRFSHSGSYSSHKRANKCVGSVTADGAARAATSPVAAASTADAGKMEGAIATSPKSTQSSGHDYNEDDCGARSEDFLRISGPEATGRPAGKIKTEEPDLYERSSHVEGAARHAGRYRHEPFPSAVPLRQHERYLCKVNDEIDASPQPSAPQPPSPAQRKKSKLSAGKGLKGSRATGLGDQSASLKSYCLAGSVEASPEESMKMSLAMNLPRDVFSKWLEEKFNAAGRAPEHRASGSPSRELGPSPAPAGHAGHGTEGSPARHPPGSPTGARSDSAAAGQPGSVADGPRRGRDQARPLDLSLPKLSTARLGETRFVDVHDSSGVERQEEPLDLTCAKRSHGELDSSASRATDGSSNDNGVDRLHENKPTMNTVTSSYGNGPVLAAFPLPGLIAALHMGDPGLRPYTGLDQAALLSHVSPYRGLVDAAALADFHDKMRHFAQGESPERGEGVPVGSVAVTDSGGPARKRQRRGERVPGGSFARDLSDETFQESGPLLPRHKYERAGRRPHRCEVCSKAFKHKQHLIEHSRLHSGEKPYRCGRCGRRFSHSGGYSQHVHRRYLCCGDPGQPGAPGADLGAPGATEELNEGDDDGCGAEWVDERG
ncbi:zinc finger E-box-binding homeobox 2-like, partial [Lethenteron reissneri]|uniref:zinc finger E-box-binding homeobox 2-like n=1 Tax=Lethenteron reissneri TaxID=7753 RepID=UPI002AB72977